MSDMGVNEGHPTWMRNRSVGARKPLPRRGGSVVSSGAVKIRVHGGNHRGTGASTATHLSEGPVLVAGGRARAGALVGVGQAWVTHSGIADDGYITLAMGRTLAGHGCWCVTPGLVSNTATSPLWVALLAAGMLMASPVVALGGWLAVLSAVTSWAVASLARRYGWAWWAGPLAAAGLAVSPVMQAA
jgi:hypothetical protein